MEQKKKKEEDVLVIRDEKTGEISVVAGLDRKGDPKRVPARPENSQEFLRFDRHGDMIDNFFRNFYRQCKDPSRFGFYRLAADTADLLIPVIKDLLKNPDANADLLAPHKVDTSAYEAETMQEAQTQGETPENGQTEQAPDGEGVETGGPDEEAEGTAQSLDPATADAGVTTPEPEETVPENEIPVPGEVENGEVKREAEGTAQGLDPATADAGVTTPEPEETVPGNEIPVPGEVENGDMKREAGGEEPENRNMEPSKTEEMKQENDERQPQQAESTQQAAQTAETQEKKNLIADSDVNWKELEQFGVKRENLSEKDLKALMNYGKTGLVTITPVLGGERYELQARLSLRKGENGGMKLVPHFVRAEPKLEESYKGYTFTEDDKRNLKQTGNLGKVVDVADERTGEIRPAYVSIDRLTNEIVDIPANKVRIPEHIGKTTLSKEEQQILRAGLALPKEITLNNGRKFHALLQVNADKRDVEFVPGQNRQRQEQKNDDGQKNGHGHGKGNGHREEKPESTQAKQDGNGGEDEKGQRQRRSWTNEDGSIRPIGKWKDDKFTEQQKADYVAGKTVVLANAKDDKGQPCTMYLKFSHEKGRPLTYSENPDLAQTVAPSNESRTQVAVNNEGKTNEATRHVKEPLQQGQTAPKDEVQKQQQEKPKKSKGMKV